jgi:hypothetical protein
MTSECLVVQVVGALRAMHHMDSVIGTGPVARLRITMWATMAASLMFLRDA